jgi:hypothetical protein
MMMQSRMKTIEWRIHKKFIDTTAVRKNYLLSWANFLYR